MQREGERDPVARLIYNTMTKRTLRINGNKWTKFTGIKFKWTDSFQKTTMYLRAEIYVYI
jgi:hypothetical protein